MDAISILLLTVGVTIFGAIVGIEFADWWFE